MVTQNYFMVGIISHLNILKNINKKTAREWKYRYQIFRSASCFLTKIMFLCSRLIEKNIATFFYVKEI